MPRPVSRTSRPRLLEPPFPPFFTRVQHSRAAQPQPQTRAFVHMADALLQSDSYDLHSLGMSIICQAVLKKFDGRRLVFSVSCRDSHEQVHDARPCSAFAQHEPAECPHFFCTTLSLLQHRTPPPPVRNFFFLSAALEGPRTAGGNGRAHTCDGRSERVLLTRQPHRACA